MEEMEKKENEECACLSGTKQVVAGLLRDGVANNVAAHAELDCLALAKTAGVVFGASQKSMVSAFNLFLPIIEGVPDSVSLRDYLERLVLVGQFSARALIVLDRGGGCEVVPSLPDVFGDGEEDE